MQNLTLPGIALRVGMSCEPAVGWFSTRETNVPWTFGRKESDGPLFKSTEG